MDSLYNVASSQHGLVTRTQLRDQGFHRNRIARWVQTGQLTRIYSKVFALPGSTATIERGLLARVLETGTDATISHTTAAWMWGIAGYEPTPVHVVVSRENRHHHHLPWRVHQFTGLPPGHRRTVRDIPTTSPALTMLHLAQVVGRQRLERAIDNAWSLGLITDTDLEKLDRELAVQGRNGIVAVRDATEERGADWVPPQSNIESRFMQLLGPHLASEFECQVPIEGEQWNARVDFLHRPSRTIIEIQSERYHTSLTDSAADTERRGRLQQAGYRVIEVWDNELFGDPETVMDRVLTAIRSVA
ncbi:MAG: type IV toxin-antitoxin system AbiEi family antitoxin domain-containing protein [Acidimicrobiia bacterium]